MGSVSMHTSSSVSEGISSECFDENFKIKFGRKLLTKAKYVKFLGLLIDENLSWKFHLSEPSKKLARTCGIFFKIRCLLSTSTLIYSITHYSYHSFNMAL